MFWQKKSKEPIYIFLDVDGVLNTERSWTTKYSIEESCVLALEMLCKDEDVHIILTSTWRNGYATDGGKHSIQIQNLVDILQKHHLAIEDITPQHISRDRSKEIERYIKGHFVGRYIILDDDSSIFSDLDMNLYLVDYHTGLTKKDVIKIKKQW